MIIKEALDLYFSKLKHIYYDTFKSMPTASWDESLNQTLFVSKPDDDGEAQWKPLEAERITLSNLCEELLEFYGSYYYLSLRGRYNNTDYYFPAIDSKTKAEQQIKHALADGEYYFKGQNVVWLASCSMNQNDDVLLFYRQKDGTLFLYDADKRFVYNLKITLSSLIASMEVLI